MAGVLPGVEAARFRKIHQGNDTKSGYTRRSSFCLYASNNQEFHIGSLSSRERNPINRAECDDDNNLDAAVKEAKIRLDRRLQTFWNKSKGNQKKQER